MALASPLEMEPAMSRGDVSHATPGLTVPSGSVTLIAGLPTEASCAALRSCQDRGRSGEQGRVISEGGRDAVRVKPWRGGEEGDGTP